MVLHNEYHYNNWYYFNIYLSIFISIFFIKLFGSSLFYRIDRITNFLNQDGYQRNQALASLKASKLFGRGELIYFPESATDFAFTFLVSQIGIIPSIIFLIIYALLIINLKSIKTDKYIITPLITIITFQLIINVLMNIGLFPIIGITLPFLSYGGSSLLSFIILITLALKKYQTILIYNMADSSYNLHNNYNQQVDIDHKLDMEQPDKVRY